MSGFVQVVQFIFTCLPTWVTAVFLGVLAFVSVLIVLAVVKAVLDAIPFV